MPSQIESELYGELAHHVTRDGDVGDHCLCEFAFLRDLESGDSTLRIGVAPNDQDENQRTLATFARATLGRITQDDYDPEYNVLPWRIVGFHCAAIGDHHEQWSFSLNCRECRMDWISDWPTIERHIIRV
jgi:hypothetical protein